MARIVVGVDGSDESREALRWALEEARLRDATLRAVYAWGGRYALVPGFGQPENFEPGALRERALEALDAVVSEVVGAESDVELEELVAEGPAASVLVDASEDGDLLVIGSRGRGGFVGLLLGSVSQQCVQHAPCPVLVVRARHSS